MNIMEEDGWVLYFSYGSNMSRKRIQKRIPSARFVAVVCLSDHVLQFHKVSKRDNSAKCDIIEAKNPNDCVFGVLYRIRADELPVLDKYEGFKKGYGKKTVTVKNSDRALIQAFTYYATIIDSSLKPYHWYKEHVIRGAKENGLPKEYIQKIADIDSITDPDPQRQAAEMAIYN